MNNTSDMEKPVSTATLNALNGKADKVTTADVASKVYAISNDGTQYVVPIYSGSAQPNTIVRRSETGAVFTAVATNNSHAANKGQVDAALATKVTGVGTSKITVSVTEPTSPALGDLWVVT